MSKNDNIICSYCHTEILNVKNDLVICNKCGSPYHKDCWEENHKCSVYGCDSRQCHNIFDVSNFDNNLDDNISPQVPTSVVIESENNTENHLYEDFLLFIKPKILPISIVLFIFLLFFGVLFYSWNFNNFLGLGFKIKNGVLIKYSAKTGYVNIPDKVKIIGPKAFKSHFEILEIKMSDNTVEIGDSAFDSCVNLKNIVISTNVKYIGDYAFNNCYNLETIVLPDNVKYIGRSAFKGCKRLEEIVLPINLEAISENTFLNCSCFKEISIPKNVESISDQAFNGCEKLENINVSSDNKYFSSVKGVLYSKDKSILFLCPEGKKGVVNVYRGTKIISNRAFFNCNKVTDINLPNTLLEIKDGYEPLAFSFCNSLSSIKIPSSVKKINVAHFAVNNRIDNFILGEDEIKLKVYISKDTDIYYSPSIEKLNREEILREFKNIVLY